MVFVILNGAQRSEESGQRLKRLLTLRARVFIRTPGSSRSLPLSEAKGSECMGAARDAFYFAAQMLRFTQHDKQATRTQTVGDAEQ